MKKSILLMVALCSVSLMAEPVRLGSLGPDTMIETRGVTASVVTGIVETATESFVGIKQVAYGQRLVDAHDSPISGTIVFSDINSNAYARVLSGDKISIPSGWSSTLRNGYGYESRLAANMNPYIYLKSPPSNLGLQSFLIKDINEKPFRFYSSKQENRAVWTSPFTPWGADHQPIGVSAFGDAAVSNLLVLVWGSADGKNYVMTSADGWFTYVAATNASYKTLSSHDVSETAHGDLFAEKLNKSDVTDIVDAALDGIDVEESDTLATVTARGATTTNAITIGTRDVGDVGLYSLGQGDRVVASGKYSDARGILTIASADGSTASGSRSKATELGSWAAGFKAESKHFTAFTWQGAEVDEDILYYTSHGVGTFNINPAGGLYGFWIGETTLGELLADKANVGDVAVSGTNWIVRAGLTGTVAFINAGNRPQAWAGTGELVVTAFEGLQAPIQCYWTLKGFNSVTLPAGVYFVGGGTWQTGMINHFTVWKVGDQVMMSFLTATEVE